MALKVKKVELQHKNCISRRRVKVTLNNGAIVYIESCYESWQQYGGTREELMLTMPIAERFNDWLHGIE
ncbi:MAG: hypothetical protein J5725_13305 [Bacteroidales bacterium]|nr:hypothetical protein [Bacteroidales bacterium]